MRAIITFDQHGDIHMLARCFSRRFKWGGRLRSMSAADSEWPSRGQ